MSAVLKVQLVDEKQIKETHTEKCFVLVGTREQDIDIVKQVARFRSKAGPSSFLSVISPHDLGGTRKQLAEWNIDAIYLEKDHRQLLADSLEYFEASLPPSTEGLLTAMADFPDSPELLENLREFDFPEEVSATLVEYAILSTSVNQRPNLLKKLISSSFPGSIRLEALRKLLNSRTERVTTLTNYLGDTNFSVPMTLLLLNHLQHQTGSLDTIQKLWPLFEHSSSLIRCSLAEVLLCQAQRIGIEGTDCLRELINHQHVPVNTKIMAIRSLVTMGETPPIINHQAQLVDAVSPEFVSQQVERLREANKTVNDNQKSQKERHAALHTLGEIVDPVKFRALCFKLTTAQDKIVSLPAFTALMNANRWSVGDMENIICTPTIEKDFRISALAAVAQRASHKDVRRILKMVLTEEYRELHGAALTSVKLAGAPQRCLLVAIANNVKIHASLRIDALRYLVENLQVDNLELCETLMTANENLLALTACEMFYYQAGIRAQSHIEEKLFSLSIDHQHAALEGIQKHGCMGVMLAVALVLQTKAAAEVRIRALNFIKSLPATPSSKQYAQQLGEILERGQQAQRTFAKPPTLPQQDDQSFAVTEPEAPVSSAPAPAVLPASAIKELKVDKPAVITAEPEIEPAVELENTTNFGELLSQAFAQGQSGFESLEAIVTQPQFPEHYRVDALRRMIQLFDESQMQSILEYALNLGTPQLQHTALTGSFGFNESLIQALETTVSDLANPSDVRLRALRRLKSIDHDKARIAPVCEKLFYDYSAEIRTTALELVFPSLRYTPKEAIEKSLINLFSEHSDQGVRCSAAWALGAFGRQEALKVLEKSSGKIFTGRSMKQAIQHAVEVLRARFPES